MQAARPGRASEVLGKHCADLIPEIDRARYREQIQRKIEGHTALIPYQRQNVRADGSKVSSGSTRAVARNQPRAPRRACGWRPSTSRSARRAKTRLIKTPPNCARCSRPFRICSCGCDAMRNGAGCQGRPALRPVSGAEQVCRTESAGSFAGRRCWRRFARLRRKFGKNNALEMVEFTATERAGPAGLRNAAAAAELGPVDRGGAEHHGAQSRRATAEGHTRRSWSKRTKSWKRR